MRDILRAYILHDYAQVVIAMVKSCEWNTRRWDGALQFIFISIRSFYSDMSVENLKFLNSEQALADLAVFVNAMNVKFKLSDSKWICFGGSYPGSLSAWFRLKFPHLVAGMRLYILSYCFSHFSIILASKCFLVNIAAWVNRKFACLLFFILNLEVNLMKNECTSKLCA